MIEAMSSAALFSREAISKDNYSPINTILTWILLVSMFLAVLAKVAVKRVYLNTFGTDDAALIVASVSPVLEMSLMITDLIPTRYSVLGSQPQPRCKFPMELAAVSHR